MSKLLSRHDRWELWMAATPGAEPAQASPTRPAPGNPAPAARPSHDAGAADLVRVVERLRGVVRTAVAALSHVGAHDEASRIRTALEAR
jgi:hypothetical protein